jgi:hypothetical protein
MDPSVAKERVDVVLNKEQYFKDNLYGYGKPTEGTAADGSGYTGRVPDIADKGIPYGVPKKLIPIFKELNKNFLSFKESHKKLEQIKNDAGGYDAMQPEAKAEFDATFELQQKFRKDVVDYNRGYSEWLQSSKNPAELIKPGSMELKIFGGGRSSRFRRRVRKTRRTRKARRS